MTELINYLPPHIAADEEMQFIQEALTFEMRKCWDTWYSMLQQIFPQTATWALPLWEAAYGIKSDFSLTTSQRREKVIAKIRSAKTATKELIRNVAAAWVNGDVEVIERSAEYAFIIKFISQFGMPDDMEGLRNAINEVKPAHLSVSYERRYLLIKEVHAMLINELITTPLDHFAGGGN